tara:strand:+ start:2559 stop:2837 length:279 start_codon:yes stop_codon:yes gene_type:complete
MVNAKDLIRQQKDKEKKRIKTYEKIYTNIEKKIIIASSTDYSYLWYEIPEYVMGMPFYKLIDCKDYIIDKLKSNSFEVDYYDPNILHIKWIG